MLAQFGQLTARKPDSSPTAIRHLLVFIHFRAKAKLDPFPDPTGPAKGLLGQCALCALGTRLISLMMAHPTRTNFGRMPKFAVRKICPWRTLAQGSFPLPIQPTLDAY